MESSEWRIGNFIYRNGNVSEIKYYDFEHFEKKDDPRHYIEWRAIKPITLTEEWLINLGYETDCDISENPMHFRKDGHLIWKPATIFYDDLYRIELKYVHQLQNLFFALKVKELTLK